MIQHPTETAAQELINHERDGGALISPVEELHVLILARIADHLATIATHLKGTTP